MKRKLFAAYFAQIWIDDDGYQVTPETERQPIVARIEASARRAIDENATEQMLGGVDSSDMDLYPQGRCLSNVGLVGRVDRHSNKSELVPPTLGDLVRLAEQSRAVQSPIAPTETREAAVRSLRRRLSPQAIEELVARYNAGEDTPALSQAYSISRGGLRKLLLAEGVSFRQQPMTPEDIERAIHLYERGLSITQVVGQVGYCFSTVRRMLHMNGVFVRERGGGKRIEYE